MKTFLQRLLSRMAPVPISPATAAAPASPAAGGLVPDLLHEHDVTPATLLRLFRQAYVPVESQPGERLVITTDTGVRLQVMLDDDRRLVLFSATYALAPGVPLADKLAFVNRVNDRVVFVRFSLLSENVLYVDHQLPYDCGVTAAAVMGCVRRIGRLAPQAIVEFAEPGLMK